MALILKLQIEKKNCDIIFELWGTYSDGTSIMHTTVGGRVCGSGFPLGRVGLYYDSCRWEGVECVGGWETRKEEERVRDREIERIFFEED